jgi:hypothetical protein
LDKYNSLETFPFFFEVLLRLAHYLQQLTKFPRVPVPLNLNFLELCD